MTQIPSRPSNEDNLVNDKTKHAASNDSLSNDSLSNDSLSDEDDYVADIDLGDSKKTKTSMSVIIAGIVLTILTIICLQVDDWSRDWTQNTSETDPAAKDIDMQPIATSLSTTDFAELVVVAMKDIPRWKLMDQTVDGNDRTKLDFVHSTFLMRYKDDIAVEIVKTVTGSTLYAKSQSRVGKGDLGQNPRNIKELIFNVREKLKNAKTFEKADDSNK
jgi:uncharacterized protein (DUF1499 family)